MPVDYYQTHRDKALAYQRQYRRLHREEINSRSRLPIQLKQNLSDTELSQQSGPGKPPKAAAQMDVDTDEMLPKSKWDEVGATSLKKALLNTDMIDAAWLVELAEKLAPLFPGAEIVNVTLVPSSVKVIVAISPTRLISTVAATVATTHEQIEASVARLRRAAPAAPHVPSPLAASRAPTRARSASLRAVEILPTGWRPGEPGLPPRPTRQPIPYLMWQGGSQVPAPASHTQQVKRKSDFRRK